MGTEFIYQDKLCRCTFMTRVYKTPSDIKPSIYELSENDIFTSACQVTVNSSTLYQITFNESDHELPLGYWCPSDVLEVLPIETEADDQSQFITINESILVTGDNIVIYPSPDSVDQISNGLKVGDRLIVDRQYETIVNHIKETRLRINRTINDDADQSVIGMWIVSNYSIESEGEYSYFTDRTTSVSRTALFTTLLSNTTFSTQATTIPISSGIDAINNNPAYSFLNSGVSALTQETGADVTYTNNSDPFYLVDRMNNMTEDLYDMYGFNYTYANRSSLMSVPLGRMLFVHGMPFQFTHLTDRRGNSKNQYGAANDKNEYSVTNGEVDMYGRTFAKEIVANMPIVVIVPGEPTFLTKVKDGIFGYQGKDNDARNSWMPFWSDLSSTEEEDLLSKLKNSDGTYDYYSMQINTAGYFQYVNAMTQTSAKEMGLSDFKYRGVTCDKIDWSKYNSSADQDYTTFEEVMGLSGGVSFAFDPLSSITDSITNTTSESQFADSLNTIKAKSQELEFLAGQSGVDLSIVDSSDYEAATAKFSEITAANVGSRLLSLLQNSSHGMSVRFPEIWRDSSNTKSYDLDMHFVAPYSTAFCKWRYVLVPFFHIFALAAPRSDTNITVYKRPHLIRAFSKGYFNVEMGIIEGLTWKRFGDGEMISADGVPMQIDVSISFKDMYHSLAMSKFGSGPNSLEYIGIFFNNTGLMDLIGTLSGVNMNRITLSERLSLYASSTMSAFSSMGSNFMRHFSDRTADIVNRYFVGL